MKIFLLMIPLLFLAPLLIMAQTVEEQVVFPDLNQIFATSALFIAGVIALTGIVTQVIILSKTGKWIVSLIIALLLGVIGHVLNLGIFAGGTWVNALILAFTYGLSANLAYGIDGVRTGFSKLKLVRPSKE